MTVGLDETHDPAARSWVESANAGDTDFPIQNLPFGVARLPGAVAPTIVVAIGDAVLDLGGAARDGVFRADAWTRERCADATINRLMALPPAVVSGLRREVHAALRSDAPAPLRTRLAPMVHPASAVELLPPVAIGDYTDFFASIEHATNVGRLFRSDRPLPPNYRYVPIAYHGRASSVVASGTPIRRPCGQSAAGDGEPRYGPSARLDFEAELGLFIGPGNALGFPIPIEEADAHVFGACLLNDWSARDIQMWESQPLGPFLSKSFATTLSPWIVTRDALAPFRVAARPRGTGEPAPLPHLLSARDQQHGALQITVDIRLSTAASRAAQREPVPIAVTGTAGLYWTPSQMVAHHTSNGCNLRPGDLFGSGTLSGGSEGSRACLLELTKNGREPLRLPDGETRTFLEDGDEVVLRAWCAAEGRRRIGFGVCSGRVVS